MDDICKAASAAFCENKLAHTKEDWILVLLSHLSSMFKKSL